MEQKNDNSNDVIASVREYHQRTRHTLQRYAAGPEALDWSLQPDPFRKFEGCETIQLPLVADSLTTTYSLLQGNNIEVQPFTIESLGMLFEMSLAISSWKQYGPDKWALRCNPSSGNLHPTEAYLVNWNNAVCLPGVYHYRSDLHGLEKRSEIETSELVNFKNTNDGLVVGLSSVYWREAWKYGERAYRYCQLDIGHAMAAISYAARTLGWHAHHMDDFSDDNIANLLGLDDSESFSDAEHEEPDLLLYISNKPLLDESTISQPLRQLAKYLQTASWQGKANRLDYKPMYQWSVIDQVSNQARKPETIKLEKQPNRIETRGENKLAGDILASHLFRQRRSAQAFDNSQFMSQTDFFRLIEKLLPMDNCPWNSSDMDDYIHPVFYLHRVKGLKPGLYALPRTDRGMESLRKHMRKEFTWSVVECCPETIPLYQLVAANSQSASRTVSCYQDIASDSAFCVSMLAEYDLALEQGEWMYRYLHWQAGMLGHVLYLEAEAINQRGTGIGCFFDDAVHQLLGIESEQLQVVYHFTVGSPVVDQRLISLPPYSRRSGNIKVDG